MLQLGMFLGVVNVAVLAVSDVRVLHFKGPEKSLPLLHVSRLASLDLQPPFLSSL